jgi:hypothetical protein
MVSSAFPVWITPCHKFLAISDFTEGETGFLNINIGKKPTMLDKS